MSKKFADFLEEQGIDWKALDSHDQRQLRLELTDVVCKDKSLTVQADKDEVDINKIIARHKVSGIPLPPQNVRFGDATNVLSYEAGLASVAAAREMFSRLPARIRARFENEPANLLAFMADEANLEEAMQLGLVPRPSVRDRVAPPSPPVPIVDSGGAETAPGGSSPA